MKTFPPPPRVPTIPGPPPIPSLIPSAGPIMTESVRPSGPPSSSRRSVPPAFFGVVAAAMMPACSVGSSEPPPAIRGEALTLAQLQITEGSLQHEAHGGLHIGAPKVRAVAAVDAGDAAELRFTYRGPSAVQVPLDDGEDRHQVGIKLRAQDGCNVIYVMWRIRPVAQVVVSIKQNPGASTYQECGANGYTTLSAQWEAEAPILRPGEPHALAASIEDGVLYVLIDGKVVWQGEAGEALRTLRGPIGMRTDNVELDGVALVPTGRQTLAPGSTSRSPGSSR
jgi:hypothetical protein